MEELSKEAYDFVDIHRRPLIFHGNAHDLNRLVQACTRALRHIEFNVRNTETIVNVYVQAPQEDEP